MRPTTENGRQWESPTSVAVKLFHDDEVHDEQKKNKFSSNSAEEENQESGEFKYSPADVNMDNDERENDDEESQVVVVENARKKQQQSHQENDGSSHRALGVVLFWLLVWMLNNVVVTLLNKATFAKYDFKYPYFLSFFHMVCNYIGSELCMFISDMHRKRQEGQRGGGYKYSRLDANVNNNSNTKNNSTGPRVLEGITRSKLDTTGRIKMLAFSVIFSLNVAIGNVSLRYVSVNFNQVMRSSVPAVTIVLGAFLGKRTSCNKKIAVAPVVVGVALACYGDMSFTVIGFVYTALSVLLAAMKVVASGEMLTGDLKLHPVDLLTKMTPLAAIQCFILSVLTGELTSIASRWNEELSPSVNIGPLFAVFVTGVFAFTMNISSLVMNKLTSPLTLCIAANAKQVLLIVLGTIVFQTEISVTNGMGIVVVLIGSAIYSYVSLMEKSAGKDAETQKDLNGVRTCNDDENGVALVPLKKMQVV